MIRYKISKDGVRTITEICDTCKCHIRDLTIADIAVNKLKGGLILKDKATGNIITRTEPRPKCYCTNCND